MNSIFSDSLPEMILNWRRECSTPSIWSLTLRRSADMHQDVSCSRAAHWKLPGVSDSFSLTCAPLVWRRAAATLAHHTTERWSPIQRINAHTQTHSQHEKVKMCACVHTHTKCHKVSFPGYLTSFSCPQVNYNPGPGPSRRVHGQFITFT